MMASDWLIALLKSPNADLSDTRPDGVISARSRAGRFTPPKVAGFVPRTSAARVSFAVAPAYDSVAPSPAYPDRISGRASQAAALALLRPDDFVAANARIASMVRPWSGNFWPPKSASKWSPSTSWRASQPDAASARSTVATDGWAAAVSTDGWAVAVAGTASEVSITAAAVSDDVSNERNRMGGAAFLGTGSRSQRRGPAIGRPSLEVTGIHRVRADAGSGRSSDSRACPYGRLLAVASQTRPGPVLDDGGRSHSPLRGSPGFAPGSLLRHRDRLPRRTDCDPDPTVPHRQVGCRRGANLDQTGR